MEHSQEVMEPLEQNFLLRIVIYNSGTDYCRIIVKSNEISWALLAQCQLTDKALSSMVG